MEFGHVDYNSTTPPDQYRCATCGMHGCKLWRLYQTFLEHQVILCCDCAGKDQNKDVSSIDDHGERLSDGCRIDQIGWYIPAVPTQEGNTYWGYSSVPQPGVEWWQKLPIRMLT